MRVLFYKRIDSWIDRAIRLWTRSPYCHCELLFSDGWRFRASPEAPAHFYLPHEQPGFASETWDCFEVEDVEEDRVRSACVEEVGSEYDWRGILFTQLLPWGWEHPHKWFCSELCVAMLQAGRCVGVAGLRPAEYSPGALARHLERSGYPQVPPRGQ